MKRFTIFLCLFLLHSSVSCSSDSAIRENEGIITLDMTQRYAPPASVPESIKKAEKYLQEKKYNEAALEAYKAYLYAPRLQEKGEGRYLLGEAYYLAGDYRQAYHHFWELQKYFSVYSNISKVLERIYEIGSAWVHGREKTTWLLFSGRDVDEGIRILTDLTDTYPYLRSTKGNLIADDALFIVAKAHFERGEYESCRKFYEKILDSYQESEWRDLSAYQVAISYLRQSEGVEYDSVPLEMAKKKFREYLEKFPQGNKVSEGQKLLLEIEESQAGHLFDTASFYMSRSGPEAALIYYLSIVREYPKTSFAKEAQKKIDEPWAKEAMAKWKEQPR